MFCSFRTPSGHHQDHISMEINFCQLGPMGVLFAIFDTPTTPRETLTTPHGHQCHPTKGDPMDTTTTPKPPPKAPQKDPISTVSNSFS